MSGEIPRSCGSTPTRQRFGASRCGNRSSRAGENAPTRGVKEAEAGYGVAAPAQLPSAMPCVGYVCRLLELGAVFARIVVVTAHLGAESRYHVAVQLDRRPVLRPDEPPLTATVRVTKRPIR